MTSEPSVSAKPDSYQIRQNARGSRENVRRDSQGSRHDSIGNRRRSEEIKDRRKSRELSEPEAKHEKIETDLSTFVSKSYEDEPKVIPVKVQVEETAPKSVASERPSNLNDIGKQTKIEENHIEAQIIRTESAKPKLKEIARYSSKDFSRTIELEQRQTVSYSEPTEAARSAPVLETKTVTKPMDVESPVVGMNGLTHKGSGYHEG